MSIESIIETLVGPGNAKAIFAGKGKERMRGMSSGEKVLIKLGIEIWSGNGIVGDSLPRLDPNNRVKAVEAIVNYLRLL